MMEDGIYEITRAGSVGNLPSYTDPGVTLTYTGINDYDSNAPDVMQAEHYISYGTEKQRFSITAVNFCFISSNVTKITIDVKFRSRDGYLYYDGTWYGSGDYVGCLLRLFINIDGTYYYSDSYSLNTNWSVVNEKTFSWSSNPATGQPWTDGDITVDNAFYGAILTAPTVEQYAQMQISQMFSTITCEEGPSLSISYKRVGSENIALTQYNQSPDTITFTSLTPIPERTELVLVKDGCLLFHGIVWGIDEVADHYAMVAKSQQVLLEYRMSGTEYMPMDSDTNINDMLSEDTIETVQDYAYVFKNLGGDTYARERFFGTITTYQGIFYVLNSWRGQFAAGMPTVIDGPGMSTLGMTSANFITGPSAGIMSTLVDHDADTYIRPGEIEIGDKILSNRFDFHGITADRFKDFFSKLGQEVRYRYDWDGYVYLDAAEEIANGSAESPLFRFRDGTNCKITKHIPEDLNPSAMIGLGTNPKVASGWGKTRTWLSKIIQTSELAEDLTEYLNARLDYDEVVYQIVSQDEFWHLHPGDYISVEIPGEPVVSVRIRQITTSTQYTQISAGKKLADLNDQFGILRNAAGVAHDLTTVRTTTIAASNECSISKTFNVTADNLALGGWQCKASIQWGLVNECIYLPDEDPDNPGSALKHTASSYMWICVYGEYFSDYGMHTYEFEAVDEMTAVGYEPYGPNDVAASGGTWKYRKDGGDWSEAYHASSYWHQTPIHDVYMGEGMYARGVFGVLPSGYPWVFPCTTDLSGISTLAYVCSSVNLDSKVLVLKIGGKVIPPGRWLANSVQGDLVVDITEFVNVAGSYTLTAELVGGIKASVNPLYYHTLAGSIEESKHTVALEE